MSEGMAVQRKVFIAIPVMSQIHPRVSTSHARAAVDGSERGFPVEMCHRSGDSLVCNARNVLISLFIQENQDCTDFFFWDADVSCLPGSMHRLLSYPIDFVGAVYPFKGETEKYPFNHLPGEQRGIPFIDPATGEQVPNTCLLEVAGVPGGFTRISRNALQQIWDAAADRKYETGDMPGLELRAICEVPYLDGKLVGEDFMLCRRWRDLGGTIYVDPEIELTHHGQKDFTGRLGDFLRKQKAIMDMPPKERLAHIFAQEKYKQLFADALGEDAA